MFTWAYVRLTGIRFILPSRTCSPYGSLQDGPSESAISRIYPRLHGAHPLRRWDGGLLDHTGTSM